MNPFTDPFPAAGNRFGYSVATMGNDRVLIGAPAHGVAPGGDGGGSGCPVAQVIRGTSGVAGRSAAGLPFADRPDKRAAGSVAGARRGEHSEAGFTGDWRRPSLRNAG